MAKDDEELREVLYSIFDILQDIGYTGICSRETVASSAEIVQ